MEELLNGTWGVVETENRLRALDTHRVSIIAFFRQHSGLKVDNRIAILLVSPCCARLIELGSPLCRSDGKIHGRGRSTVCV